MTRIGLLSDTHGSIPEAFFEFTKDCEQIWHAGDIGTIELATQLSKGKTIVAVYGNIDGHDIRTSNCPKEQLFMCEDVKVYMTHIGGYPGRYIPHVRNMIIRERPKLVITGHSHILKVINDKKLGHLHLNPGAAGKNGMHKVITMMRFEIDGDRISNLEIHESARRKA
jgi:uncharacterized protein